MNRNSQRAGRQSVRASSHWLRAVASTTLMSFIVTSCGGKTTSSTPPGGGQLGSASPLSDRALVQLENAPPGLDLRVSEGKAGAPALDTSKLPPARKLSAQEADAVVVGTYNVTAASSQKTLVTELLATGKPVVAVAIRNPYDVAHLPAVKGYLAAYSWTDVELRAAARVIAGAVGPRGKLPVPVQRADDPGRVLYPVGHGLSYRA